MKYEILTKVNNMEERITLDKIIGSGLESYSSKFKNEMNFSLGYAEERIDFIFDFAPALVDEVLSELNTKYGIEENDENFNKLKDVIFFIISCRMNNLADILVSKANKL